MSKLRTLSGAEVIGILAEFSFGRVAQSGSHVKVRRVLANGTHQNLTVPLHKEIDRGTLLAIYRKALLYVPESELRHRFYTD